MYLFVAEIVPHLPCCIVHRSKPMIEHIAATARNEAAARTRNALEGHLFDVDLFATAIKKQEDMHSQNIVRYHASLGAAHTSKTHDYNPTSSMLCPLCHQQQWRIIGSVLTLL